MEIFCHHIYEYEKGLRNLILHTAQEINKDFIEMKLKSRQIPYIIYKVNEEKINVFFGNIYCIEVIKEIGKSDLKEYTDEEDFILGIMLGYDRVQQCERYIKRISEKESVGELVG